MISAIALDLGTTSIKAGLLDGLGAITSIVAHPAPKVSAEGGRYESDALAYAATAELALSECVAKGSSGNASECRSLGLCSQRSSFLLWERAGGKPVTPLVSWQDNRGAASCRALRAHESMIRDLTGLPLTPYYFAPKLRVVLQGNPDWRARLERGELLAGTLDTFMIWRWTAGRHFVTDASMAARTLLMDVRRQQWSPQLCELFSIPLAVLPEIKPSAGLNLPLENGLILQASVGDQSAALFASVGEEGAEALVNLGTGCFVVRYLPSGKQVEPAGYLHTLVYQDGAHQVHFAIEGTLNSIAAALAPYFADEYRIGDECHIGDPDLGGIFCVAEPSGLGAPYFRNDIGLRFSQPVTHLTRSQTASLLLEAVVFRVARILEDFHRMSAIERVYLSGGLSELPGLLDGIARCVAVPVYRLEQAESSLCGAALLAAEREPARDRKSRLVEVRGDVDALPRKYLRWKHWLDGLLA